MSLVTTEDRGAVRVITYSTPPLGTMTGVGSTEMFTAVAAAGEIEAVRVIVITGGVPGIFIRHYDVGELSDAADAVQSVPPRAKAARATMKVLAPFPESLATFVYVGRSPDYVESLVSDTKKAFNEDQIDDPAGIKTAKIYLFSGTNDTKVPQPIVKAVELFNGHQASLPDKILNRAKQPSYSKRRYNIERANVRTGKLCAAASSAKLPKKALNFSGERGRLLHSRKMSALFHFRPSLNVRVGLLSK